MIVIIIANTLHQQLAIVHIITILDLNLVKNVHMNALVAILKLRHVKRVQHYFQILLVYNVNQDKV